MKVPRSKNSNKKKCFAKENQKSDLPNDKEKMMKNSETS